MLQTRLGQRATAGSIRSSHGLVLTSRTSVVTRIAAPDAPMAAQAKDPFAEKTVYNDNMIDQFFIQLYTEKMAALLPGVHVPPKADYDDFVRVSKEIMRGRTPEEQHSVVHDVLVSLMPPYTPEVFRTLFPPTKWSCQLNAAIAALCFYWLVGEAERRSADIEVAPGKVVNMKSVVHIKKCRYLEASGCVGLCVNMCKVPTQNFFTNDCGLPLTMNPNFEDLSCEMVFGQHPPPMKDDPAYAQPCFVPQCSMASRKLPCPKTDPDR